MDKLFHTDIPEIIYLQVRIIGNRDAVYHWSKADYSVRNWLVNCLRSPESARKVEYLMQQRIPNNAFIWAE